jgi:hypothetical protein
VLRFVRPWRWLKNPSRRLFGFAAFL